MMCGARKSPSSLLRGRVSGQGNSLCKGVPLSPTPSRTTSPTTHYDTFVKPINGFPISEAQDVGSDCLNSRATSVAAQRARSVARPQDPSNSRVSCFALAHMRYRDVRSWVSGVDEPSSRTLTRLHISKETLSRRRSDRRSWRCRACGSTSWCWGLGFWIWRARGPMGYLRSRIWVSSWESRVVRNNRVRFKERSFTAYKELSW